MKYVILFLIFIILMLWMNRNNTEDFVTIKKIEGPIKWGRNTCNYQMNNTLSGVLDTHKMTETDKDWNLYMPCTYDDINGEIEKMKFDANGRYFIIDGADEITAKNVIWDNMVKYYGRNQK